MPATGNSENSSISTTQKHYQNHLAEIYSWMAGDFSEKTDEQFVLLSTYDIYPVSSGIAIDLGAGHGIHSMAMAKCGFSVVSIDSNQHLLDELKENTLGWAALPINEDIRNIHKFSHLHPELILCGGDTIAHLSDIEDLSSFITNCFNCLRPDGKLVLSFRDYSVIPPNRFIPVKSDEERILTCILEYEATRVLVTDMLYIKRGPIWEQRISSYYKIRLTTDMVTDILYKTGFSINTTFTFNGMVYIVASN